MAKIKDEWYIIVNPHAGSGKTMYKWIPAENKLKELGVPFYTVFTTHKHHAAELAATAARTGYRKIMAVGGDGSIHEVFNGVMAWCESTGADPSEFHLAVAPIGSGNDWIKSYNVPSDTLDVIDVVAEGNFTKQDVVRITSDDGSHVCYMANIGGIGFDSHVCERVNRQKEHGKRSELIYVNALRYTVFHLKPFRAKFIVDGELVFAGKVLSVALGTGQYSGGGMRQVCLADPADGLLDMVIVPRMSIARVFKEIPRVFAGTTDKSEHILYTRGKCIEILPMDEHSADIYEVDGEIEGKMPLKLEVLERQVNVLCKKES